MNFKKLLILLLIGALAFSLAACGESQPEAPAPEDLQEMTDEDTIRYLLENYKGLDYTNSVWEVSLSTKVADTETMTSEMTVSVKNGNFSVASKTTVAGVTVPVNYVYLDGILYMDAAGTKVKGSASGEYADELFDSAQNDLSYADDVSIFGKKALLRSENGDYLLVLSEPSKDMLEYLNAQGGESVPETDEEEKAEEDTEEGPGDAEDSPAVYTGVSDFYLSLAFTAEGALKKLTMGTDLTVSEGGIESEVSMLVEYALVTADPLEIAISAPADAASYKETEFEPPVSTDPEAPEGSADSE